MSKIYDIVCFSSQEFRRKDDLWTNKQHIMKRLAATNRVLFVNPLSCFSVRRCIRLKKPFPVLERDPENLWIFWSHRITSRRFARNWKIHKWFNTALLRRCIRKLHMRKNLVLWFYDPEMEYMPGKLGERLVVYDCVDIMSAFPRYGDPVLRAEFIEKEERLVRRSDLVFATTDAIYREKKVLNESTYLVPNVGDFEHFSAALSPDLKPAGEIARMKRPVIGFIGAVTDYKLDIPLLEAVAQMRPDWSLVLAGPVLKPCDRFGSSSLSERENVHVLGKVPYEKLPAYVKGFDVCIIPYALNDYTRGVFPIKFFEYMATGKPVVSTPLPSLLGYSPLVSFGKSPTEFIGAVEEALREEDESIVRKRIETARENTWPGRIRRIMGLIEQHWPNKQSASNQQGFG
ncbi:MAG: glycosyltransferase [Candidatus Tritonobacter lacicola]|nr:glycosyltransferase [Candidatus Tritonobacter lacicola]